MSDHECAKCGESVYVEEGLEFNEGDFCWECTLKHVAALETLVREYRHDNRDHLGLCRYNRHYAGLGSMDDRCDFCRRADVLLNVQKIEREGR